MMRRFDRLGVRLAVLLSIALIPIGSLAGLQIYRSFRQSDEMAQTALLGITAEAAASERALIHQALGAADALVPTIFDVGPENPRCSEILKEYVDRSSVFVFAGFTSLGGKLQCASQGAGLDLSTGPQFQELRTSARPAVRKRDPGQVTGIPVILVSQPIMQADKMAGYLSISIPYNDLRLRSNYVGSGMSFDLVTYNASGQVLTANRPDGSVLSDAEIAALLPRDIQLSELTSAKQMAFTSLSQSGTERQFVVVPIVPDLVFALGSMKSRAADRVGLQAAASIVFPLLMWFASILVAYVAVDRLVIRHIRELRGQMRRFALGDRSAPPELLRDAPAELQEVSQTFHNVGRILIRDEQQLAHSVREKTILLKEVHHRVKNNLQLIASIMNMQIRQVRDDTAKRVLRSVQDRVMSLATVHRRLYQVENLAAVAADDLLGEIIGQLAKMLGARPFDPLISTDIDPVLLTPDEAVPIALLTTEAVTNALKYAGSVTPGQRPTICVGFKQTDDGATLSVANSIDQHSMERARTDQQVSGLGSQLMNAFAAQLGTRIAQSLKDEVYRLELRIPLARDGIPPRKDGDQ